MLLFYDAEVFLADWLFVIVNPITKERHVIINDAKKLASFYEQHKDHIWVGYNSRHYDQYILKGILCGFNPHSISKYIIADKKQGWQYSSLFMKIPLYQFDVMTTLHGLKELEGFMGHDIRETTVSFDINRKLTEKEIEEVVHYCTNDVEETMEIFLHRKEEFDTQMALLKAFELPLKYIGKTKAQLAALILKARKMNRDDEFDLILPDTLKIKKYIHVVDWYQNPINHSYEKSLETVVSGVPHTFAWGGLHGARDKYQDEGILVSVDVNSFYPSIMLEYGFLSRNVEDPNLYQQIYNERLRLKSLKDPMQQPYKIVLNATYGAMKHQYNNLYDPRQANNVCVGGQLLLLDLIEQLEPYWTLIQSNTDGLIGKIQQKEELDTIKTICKEWEERTRMKLDYELFYRIFQKDVNNYIIIKEDGSYKSKGGYVKKLNAIDNDLPIVNEALKKYFINKIPVEDTIYSCKDLMQFQKVVKVSSKYSHALHGNKPLSEKTLRVFASRNSDPGVFKVKGNSRVEKIANTPESCFIVNDNVISRRIPRRLDRDWYVNLAKKRLEDFVG
ncbi:hypothetical protein EDC18_10580 [Natranaerovirga pectinivora]|uniref:Uncharacterized protein n=1 Tax=Natranaerovirga pectinivora TaxID=682400 RepID=A0A4R3MJL4_9FIRM|nr:hypothetical protein [Natranaerovirga pectinivora]TCT14599.1 hypothetical protein EDC18_10580 [Natranaerovirga pectinivora]